MSIPDTEKLRDELNDVFVEIKRLKAQRPTLSARPIDDRGMLPYSPAASAMAHSFPPPPPRPFLPMPPSPQPRTASPIRAASPARAASPIRAVSPLPRAVSPLLRSPAPDLAMSAISMSPPRSSPEALRRELEMERSQADIQRTVFQLQHDHEAAQTELHRVREQLMRSQEQAEEQQAQLQSENDKLRSAEAAWEDERHQLRQTLDSKYYEAENQAVRSQEQMFDMHENLRQRASLAQSAAEQSLIDQNRNDDLNRELDEQRQKCVKSGIENDDLKAQVQQMAAAAQHAERDQAIKTAHDETRAAAQETRAAAQEQQQQLEHQLRIQELENAHDSALRTAAQTAADQVRCEADVQIQGLQQQLEEAKTDMTVMRNRFEEGEIKGAMREMENSAQIDHRLRELQRLHAVELHRAQERFTEDLNRTKEAAKQAEMKAKQREDDLQATMASEALEAHRALEEELNLIRNLELTKSNSKHQAEKQLLQQTADSKIQELQRALATADDKVKRLTQDEAILQDENDSARHEIASLKPALATAELKLASSEKSVAEHRQILVHVEGLKLELDEVRRGSHDHYEQEARRWQATNTDLQAQLSSLENANATLKKDVQHAQNGEKNAREQEKTLLSQLGTVQMSMEDRSEMESREHMRREAARQQQWEAAEMDFQRHLQEMEQMNAAKLSALQQRLDRGSEENREISEENADLQTELSAVKSQFDSSTRALQQLQQRTMELGSESAEHQMEMGQVRRELAQSHHEQQMELNRARQAESSLQHQVRKLNQQLEEASGNRVSAHETEQLRSQVSKIRQDCQMLADGQMKQAVAEARADGLRVELEGFLREISVRSFDPSSESTRQRLIGSGKALHGSLLDLMRQSIQSSTPLMLTDPSMYGHGSVHRGSADRFPTPARGSADRFLPTPARGSADRMM